IIKIVMAKTACDHLRAGLSAPDAARAAIAALDRVAGKAGMILVDRNGHLGFAFNTDSLARAWIDAEGKEGTGGPCKLQPWRHCGFSLRWRQLRRPPRRRRPPPPNVRCALKSRHVVSATKS